MKEDSLYNTLIIACIIGIIVVTALIFTNKTNEPFTELYFEDHQNLPREIELGKEYSFRFTVHNVGGKGVNYFYEFSKDNRLLDAKTFILEDSKTTTFREVFTINENFEEAKMTIKLLNKDQEIHFWVKQI